MYLFLRQKINWCYFWFTFSFFMFSLCLFLSDVFQVYIYIHFIYKWTQEVIKHCFSAWYGDNLKAKQRKACRLNMRLFNKIAEYIGAVNSLYITKSYEKILWYLFLLFQVSNQRQFSHKKIHGCIDVTACVLVALSGCQEGAGNSEQQLFKS